MLRFIPLLLSFSMLLSACAQPSLPPPEPPTITVHAAASLTDAFSQIVQQFEAANPGTRVALNFGGSSALAAQLAEGVPGDVFASANTAQMQVAIEAGRVTAEPAVFLSNWLTIITPADNPAGITSLEDLAAPGVALVLAAPGVPVRDYTDEIAGKAGLGEAFYQNVVSEEENVRQVAAKIALGEADAGVVYTSDVTPDIRGQVQQIDIPDDLNVIATYPIAPIADSANPQVARAFIAYVLSDEGQAVLAEWGFGPIP